MKIEMKPFPKHMIPKIMIFEKVNTKKLKQQFQGSNLSIKIIVLGLLLLLKSSFIDAQNKMEIGDRVHLQNIILTKDKIDKAGRSSDNPYFHIAFNYEYGDSISLFVNRKNFYNVNLSYVLDTNTSFYPYNRALLKLSKKQISKHSKCQIIFRNSKRRVTFHLNRKFEYYVLKVSKNTS